MKAVGIAEAVGEPALREAAKRLAEYEGFPFHRRALL
jgi:histidinol dehydrogenase